MIESLRCGSGDGGVVGTRWKSCIRWRGWIRIEVNETGWAYAERFGSEVTEREHEDEYEHECE